MQNTQYLLFCVITANGYDENFLNSNYEIIIFRYIRTTTYGAVSIFSTFNYSRDIYLLAHVLHNTHTYNVDDYRLDKRTFIRYDEIRMGEIRI